MSYTATGIKPHGFHRAPTAGTLRKAGRAVRTAVRRQIAKRTSLRVLSVIAGFGIALLPRWLRWIPAALLLIPGFFDEIAFAAGTLLVIMFRRKLRRELRASLRLAIGARHLTAVNEAVFVIAVTA